ncbi:hypothetical protein Tco_1449157 [Tanacetum coccineum]
MNMTLQSSIKDRILTAQKEVVYEFAGLQKGIAIVKVWCNSKRGPEFTWEREDQMKLKYSILFSDVSG